MNNKISPLSNRPSCGLEIQECLDYMYVSTLFKSCKRYEHCRHIKIENIVCLYLNEGVDGETGHIEFDANRVVAAGDIHLHAARFLNLSQQSGGVKT